VIYNLQDVFNLLPDLSLHDMIRSMYTKTNDQMLVVYQAAMIRCILALHDLINNKLSNRESEKSEESGRSLVLAAGGGGDDKKKTSAATPAGSGAAATGSASKDSKEEPAKK
jgi:26S proteasome regulatory subunit N8